MARRVGALRARLLPAGLAPLTLVVVGASPVAMNMSTIAALAGTGAREMALLTFAQYSLAALSLPVVTTLGLALVYNTP